MKKNILKGIAEIFLFCIFTFCLLIPVYTQVEVPSVIKVESVGNFISFNLKDTDLKDALKIIAQASGLNIILDKDVKATVNINLKDIDWQTALDAILKTNELAYRIQGNIIRVMTLATIKKEEELTPLVTKIITLNFAKTEVLKSSLAKMLSARGSMEVNVPTNSLIINDIIEIVNKVEEVAKKLDIPTPQVLIEALVVSVKLTDIDMFGINWTIATHKQNPERKILQTLIGDMSKAVDLYYGNTVLNQWDFTNQLALYAEDKRAKILANPRVITLDNLPAQIEITEQVPYTSTSTSTEGGTTTSTQFKEVGIRLYVTPHITKDRFISMSVKAEQSYLAGYVGKTNEPQIDSRKAETNLMLKDKETVVIGGLRKADNTVTIDKIPILGDIPFLGKFFRKENKETTETELLIFVTPHIMEEPLLSEREERKLQKSKDELYIEEKKERDKAISKVLAEQQRKEDLLRKEEAGKKEELELKQKQEEEARFRQEELMRKEQERKRKEQTKLEQERKQQGLARQKEEKAHQRQLEAEQKEKQRLEAEQKQQEELTRREQKRQAKEEQARLKRQRKEQERKEKQEQTKLKKQQEEPISSLYQKALTYYKNNQFEQAKETFNKILSQDPNQTKARSYLESKIPHRIKELELRQKEQTPETKQ